MQSPLFDQWIRNAFKTIDWIHTETGIHSRRTFSPSSTFERELFGYKEMIRTRCKYDCLQTFKYSRRRGKWFIGCEHYCCSTRQCILPSVDCQSIIGVQFLWQVCENRIIPEMIFLKKLNRARTHGRYGYRGGKGKMVFFLTAMGWYKYTCQAMSHSITCHVLYKCCAHKILRLRSADASNVSCRRHSTELCNVKKKCYSIENRPLVGRRWYYEVINYWHWKERPDVTQNHVVPQGSASCMGIIGAFISPYHVLFHHRRLRTLGSN